MSTRDGKYYQWFNPNPVMHKLFHPVMQISGGESDVLTRVW